MSLQFSRSVRALRVDSFRASRIALVLAIFLMIALIAWFFIAEVTLYETSTTINVSEGGHVVATFTPEAISRLRQGQAATLRLAGSQDQPALSLPAYVFSLDEGGTQAEFVVLSSEMPSKQGKLSGRLDVEVEYITPAELVMRTSGRFMNQGEISVSPQSAQGQSP